MPVCKHCGAKWSWSDTLKRSWTFRRGMRCRNCKKKQYQTRSSRKKTSLIAGLIPVILIPAASLFDLAPVSILALGMVLGILCIGVMPFFFELTSKEEPLW
ncbi:TIGR04104 family putative zinc finger protein [Mesobacillus foraminis]|uniref:TIGR04104 family putative zinc finger protein n=1 Tax=Mesobacillus foraminis TaxID=279826 RepID=UPI000EF4EA3A|nr:TIGR04104 family putative zinc finger protein [Mesobacillus foraminis]